MITRRQPFDDAAGRRGLGLILRFTMACGTAVAMTLTASAATFVVGGSQEIGGAAPRLWGSLDGTPATNPATGTAPNWTFSWSGAGIFNFAGSTCTYTRVNATARGLVTFDMGGANLTNASGGVALDGVSLKTECVSEGGSYYRSDGVSVVNVGEIAMGGIDTAGNRMPGSYAYPYGGSVSIGTSEARAGGIRIGHIHSYAGFAGAMATYAQAGGVTIHGSEDVLIVDSQGTPGDIQNWSSRSSADVLIEHAGTLRVGMIDCTIYGGGMNSRSGNITLNGGNSSGDLTCASLLSRYLGGNYSGARPALDISNYRNVLIDGSIQTWTDNTGNNHPAGDVTVTNGITGDIGITGAINLNAAYTGGNSDGTLRLAAGGKVTLAELDMAKVLSASLSSGTKKTEITGTITNFDMTYSGGSGTTADPYVTTQTALRTPAGQRIVYAVKGGANLALNNAAYRVADLNGNAGQGGILMPKPARGTVVLFM